MKNSVFEKITQAIDEHRLLLLTDEAGLRVIEPYLIFESIQGDMLIHGWQQGGAYRKTPPPRWCNLHLDDIHAVEILAERFPKPHRDYNPRSVHFHRVVYEIARAPSTVTLPPPAPSRLKTRARRSPPPGRSGTQSSRSPHHR